MNDSTNRYIPNDSFSSMDLHKAIEEVEKIQAQPMITEIRVNPNYMEKLFQDLEVLVGKSNFTNMSRGHFLGSFTGIPVVQDNSVKTFEFTYKRG